jgi:ABC-type amino acid transport substrate-binding protein
MKRTRLAICVFFMCALICTTGVFAADFKVAVLQLPVSESFVNLIKALGEVTGNTFATEVVPPSRGIYLIENKEVDAMFPATKSTDPKKNLAQNFDYASTKAYQMIFVLYANKGEPVGSLELRNGNQKNYKVETTASLAKLFEFTPLVTTSIEASLKRVESGAIDGLIYPQDSADPPLRTLGLKNIVRSLYSTNDITFALQKGQAGGGLDKILSEGVAKLKASGRLNKIIEASIANSVYNNWQP